MSNSSKAFEKLLKDEVYFREKMLNFLKFKGNRKKTGEIAAELLCNFNDKRADIVQAIKSVEEIQKKIKTIYESTPYEFTGFPAGSLGKDGKEYLQKLFELLKKEHQIFLYCVDGKWQKALEKYEKMLREKAKNIMDEFDNENENSQLYVALGACVVTLELEDGERTPEELSGTKDFQDLKRVCSRYSKDFREIFPHVAELFDTKIPSSKRRKLNPSEDD